MKKCDCGEEYQDTLTECPRCYIRSQLVQGKKKKKFYARRAAWGGYIK